MWSFQTTELFYIFVKDEIKAWGTFSLTLHVITSYANDKFRKNMILQLKFYKLL